MKALFLVLLSTMVLAADSRDLKRELASTESWLKASGAEKEAGWKAFLLWDELQAQLSSSTPDLDRLRVILNRWRKNQVDLDHPRFVSSQRALKEFVLRVETDRLGDRESACAAWKAALDSAIADQSAALEAGRAVGWLRRACGEPKAGEALLARRSFPNLRFSVSSKAIAFGLEGMEIHNEQFVSNTVQGVHTEGRVFTDGRLTARPVLGAPGRGEVEIALDATIRSPNIRGQKGNVEIASRSSGTAKAVGRLALDGNGIRLVGTNAWASMGTEVLGISAPLRIVERIAWRKADRSQAETSWEASRMAASGLRSQFAAELSEKLTKASAELVEPFKETLRFQGAYPKAVTGASDSARLSLSVTEQTEFQLASPTAPPALVGSHDLSLAVHESFGGNFLAPYMGGKQEWDTSFYELHKLLTMEEPTELRVHDNAPRWYFWVDEYRPVVTDFGTERVAFTFHGRRIGRVREGTEAVADRPFTLAVNYVPELSGPEPRLRRQGAVALAFTDGKADTPVEAELAAMLQRKMAAFFPEVLEFGGLSLPKGSGWEKLRRFQLKEFRSEAGWLVLGFSLK